ncbi:MAG: 3-oxoacyl-[acyl-carrier-protein] reductase [Armatimonadetes bacterium]|jgi:3-oxoacyl-[acyl-carrier protein] reductase|nr:3-oxoacyl-[acyl-carrier-protein] reductase [Armatimonadota bacterium]MDI9584045.1 3-oxoacyl-[acyl-carrier-protein] reductase [Acidobacteriota bacterium]
MTDKPLDGKSALITGASRGIGRAIALAFARAGCDVAINYVNVPDRDNAAEAGQVADEIRALGSEAFCVEADVTDLDAVEEMAAAVIDRFGKLDILVNNAGITADSTLKKLSKDAWDRVLAVNLTGAFHCTRAVIEHMRERQSGRVISLASVVALSGNIGQANYAASKAGLIGFTKSLAREVARRNITVNAIAPGFINTEMVQAMPAPALEQTLASIPMGRLGEAEEIADAAVFLASDAAKYITGHVLSVNGGLYM